jgi:hypothetical protein
VKGDLGIPQLCSARTQQRSDGLEPTSFDDLKDGRCDANDCEDDHQDHDHRAIYANCT